MNFHTHHEPAREAKQWLLRMLQKGYYPDLIQEQVFNVIQDTPKYGYKYHYLRCILRDLEKLYDSGLFNASAEEGSKVDLEYVDRRLVQVSEAREKLVRDVMDRAVDERVGELLGLRFGLRLT